MWFIVNIHFWLLPIPNGWTVAHDWFNVCSWTMGEEILLKIKKFHPLCKQSESGLIERTKFFCCILYVVFIERFKAFSFEQEVLQHFSKRWSDQIYINVFKTFYSYPKKKLAQIRGIFVRIRNQIELYQNTDWLRSRSTFNYSVFCLNKTVQIKFSYYWMVNGRIYQAINYQAINHPTNRQIIPMLKLNSTTDLPY